MSRATTKPDRLTWLSAMMVGGFVLACYSQVRVHLLERREIIARAVSTDRYTISRTDKAKRGPIFTADGKPLAQDEETFEFGVNFRRIPQSEAFLVDLAAAADVPASELAQLAASGVGNRVWKEPIGSGRAKRILAVKRSWRADGVSLAPTGLRAYPMGEATAGFVGVMRGGKAQGGLELSKDRLLSGRDGQRVGLVDRQGSFLPMRLDEATRERQDGVAITTTIDSAIQQAAANAVRSTVERFKADSGVAIVYDPSTGDLLAMANWPSFDPQALQRAVGRNIKPADYNPSYMGSLEPGSTFKILTLAKALDENIAHVGDTFFCTGEMKMGKARPVRCDLHHGTRSHGRLDLTGIIAKSCNVASAKWALNVGYDGMLDYVRELGLLQKTELGLPFEKPGFFRLDEYDKRRQIADVGFGQSITATPVALASAFASLANGGERMEPRLIKRIGYQEQPVVSAGPVITEDSAADLMRYMEAVIETDAGTGHTLRIPGYRLAGKTGTAQKVGAKTKGYVSNFIGYVPARQPKVAILVMIDHPKVGGYYGALVAGPAFTDIARAVIRRFRIPPSEVAL